MTSKERDRFKEKSKSPDSHKMKAEAMCSGEDDTKKAGAASTDEQGGDNQQSTLNRRFSAESQEFEFNKLGSGLTSTHRNEDQLHYELGGGLASADELFYKGQLLPLQYNNTRAPAFTNSETGSPISPWHDTIEIPSSKLSLSSLRDQDVRFSSCRMDHVSLDSSLFELTRSSSFRAHSSSYCNFHANYAPTCTGLWDSSTTTSCAGESSSCSSSRDSNGSSQDSCTPSDHHICCHLQTSATGSNGSFNSLPRRKPGLMHSWKMFLNGLRRNTQPTAAGRKYQSAQSPSFHGTLKTRGTAANLQAGSQRAKLTVCECKASREKSGNISDRHIKGSVSKTRQLWTQEKEIMGWSSNGNLQTAGRRNDHSPDCNKKDKELTRRGSLLSGSRWQGYTKRIKPISILKATLVEGHANYDHVIFPESCSPIRDQPKGQVAEEGARWRPVTYQMPPLQKRPSQPSLVSTVISGVKEPSRLSFRFFTVSNSCPPSVRSSPNHSGLLVAPSPPSHSGPLTSPIFNNISTVQELHSAVQGAIDHCKQSISTPSVAMDK